MALAAVAASAALACCLASCGGGETQEAAPAGGGDQSALSGTISTNGSTSMEKVIGSLSEAFMDQNKDVTITYDATGSGTGIECAKNGSCDVGLASRNLKDEETGLKSITVALDGIAVIVNNENPLEEIAAETVKGIYVGEITGWEEVQ